LQCSYAMTPSDSFACHLQFMCSLCVCGLCACSQLSAEYVCDIFTIESRCVVCSRTERPLGAGFDIFTYGFDIFTYGPEVSCVNLLHTYSGAHMWIYHTNLDSIVNMSHTYSGTHMCIYQTQRALIWVHAPIFGRSFIHLCVAVRCSVCSSLLHCVKCALQCSCAAPRFAKFCAMCFCCVTKFYMDLRVYLLEFIDEHLLVNDSSSWVTRHKEHS